MASYRLNEEAAEDMERLFEYGIDHFGLEAACAYVEGMEQRFNELASHPFQYQAVDHICEGYRRSVYVRHSIYYRVNPDKDGVEIVRILGRENTADQL